jgi:hypothetical protein
MNLPTPRNLPPIAVLRPTVTVSLLGQLKLVWRGLRKTSPTCKERVRVERQPERLAEILAEEDEF